MLQLLTFSRLHSTKTQNSRACPALAPRLNLPSPEGRKGQDMAERACGNTLASPVRGQGAWTHKRIKLCTTGTEGKLQQELRHTWEERPGGGRAACWGPLSQNPTSASSIWTQVVNYAGMSGHLREVSRSLQGPRDTVEARPLGEAGSLWVGEGRSL